MQKPRTLVGESDMSSINESSFNKSGKSETNHTNSVQINIDFLIELLDPFQLSNLLDYAAKSEQNLLLTLEQTSRFLNIESCCVAELASSGKLAPKGNGKFHAKDVHNYSLEMIKRRKKGLKRIAEIENSFICDTKQI